MSSLVMIDHFYKGNDTSTELKVTGIDETYDRYLVIASRLTSHYNTSIDLRVTKSGTAHTSSDYESTGYNLNSNASGLTNRANTGNTVIQFYNNNSGSNMYNSCTGFMYLYLTNFGNSSGYDYIDAHGVSESNAQNGWATPLASCVVKNASASDGIVLTQSAGVNQLFMGQLSLYGIV